eukprot:m.30672 g.30672  ORF g.30672 m.30672 type:complete len:349 (-) comp8226_c0_seq1:25-1071(-)
MASKSSSVIILAIFLGTSIPSETIATSPGVFLKNTAKPNVYMPAAGLGTGCKIGGCQISPGSDMVSYNMTLSWLKMGGRRIDGADSYGCEPGIGKAILDSGIPRNEVFITSKTGPGGLCWPLGYNETINQAKEIVKNYSTTYVDLLLIHWPVNYGPCPIHGPKPSIPTTDPYCDTGLPSYDEKECRLSTWKAMLEVYKMGLATAVGVSNFNVTHLEEIKSAGLPLPSANQVSFAPTHGPAHAPCTPLGTKLDTCQSLLQYCTENNINFNGYSPFGGARGAGNLLTDPKLEVIAKNHNVSTAQIVLQWQWAKNITVNPEATNPDYQAENLHFFDFELTPSETEQLNTWT